MHKRHIVLLVGHCLPDSFGLSRCVRRAARGAKVERVNSDRTLRKALPRASLLLVNRQLDGRFSQPSGIELIGALSDQGVGASLMLVSNFSDAQAEALDVGADAGFGKRDLHRPESIARIQQALARHSGDPARAQKRPGVFSGPT